MSGTIKKSSHDQIAGKPMKLLIPWWLDGHRGSGILSTALQESWSCQGAYRFIL